MVNNNNACSTPEEKINRNGCIALSKDINNIIGYVIWGFDMGDSWSFQLGKVIRLLPNLLSMIRLSCGNNQESWETESDMSFRKLKSFTSTIAHYSLLFWNFYVIFNNTTVGPLSITFVPIASWLFFHTFDLCSFPFDWAIVLAKVKVMTVFLSVVSLFLLGCLDVFDESFVRSIFIKNNNYIGIVKQELFAKMGFYLRP